jgi:hypothetical protein
MPRNPDKTRCTIPGCGNWAMLGRTRCRAHLCDELGPQGAGAPLGNLNALIGGAHARPLPPHEFERLADAVANQPEDLAYQFGLAVHDIQARTNDTYLTLIALRALLSRLIDHTAQHLFAAELEELFHLLPQPARNQLEIAIERIAARQSLEQRLRTLRKIKRSRKWARKIAKTIAGTGTG